MGGPTQEHQCSFEVSDSDRDRTPNRGAIRRGEHQVIGNQDGLLCVLVGMNGVWSRIARNHPGFFLIGSLSAVNAAVIFNPYRVDQRCQLPYNSGTLINTGEIVEIDSQSPALNGEQRPEEAQHGR
jgi:hypothetical protein